MNVNAQMRTEMSVNTFSKRTDPTYIDLSVNGPL